MASWTQAEYITPPGGYRVADNRPDYAGGSKGLPGLYRVPDEGHADQDGDMVEHVGGTTAPLRAWVKVGADLPKEGVLLGPVGRRILKLTPGDEVWVRRLEVKAVAPA